MPLDLFRISYRALFEKDRRLAQFRGVLQQALLSPAYQPALDSVGIRGSAGVRAVEDIGQVLAALPVRPLPEVVATVNGSIRPVHRLFSLADDGPRTAVLWDGLKESQKIRCFEEIESPRLALFQPEALAAPAAVLRSLAHRARLRSLPVTVSHSVTALCGPSLGWLSRQDRDLLWESFRVPVYLHFLGLAGETLAWECETHECLHVVDETVVFESSGDGNGLVFTSLVNDRIPCLRVETGFSARITFELCDCGRQGARLLELAPMHSALQPLPAAADSRLAGRELRLGRIPA